MHRAGVRLARVAAAVHRAGVRLARVAAAVRRAGVRLARVAATVRRAGVRLARVAAAVRRAGVHLARVAVPAVLEVGEGRAVGAAHPVVRVAEAHRGVAVARGEDHHSRANRPGSAADRPPRRRTDQMRCASTSNSTPVPSRLAMVTLSG